jgi:hypothetical protein
LSCGVEIFRVHCRKSRMKTTLKCLRRQLWRPLTRPSRRDSFFNNNIGHSCLLYQTSHTRIYREVVFIMIFYCVVLLYALILNSLRLVQMIDHLRIHHVHYFAACRLSAIACLVDRSAKQEGHSEKSRRGLS